MGSSGSARWGDGIRADFRRRLPHYIDDYRSGLNGKSLASTLFLFFACLAPAITFGGVMAAATGGYIGAVEMILASAVCGIAYAVFSGQPLVILGGTGPMLVITGLLYTMCLQFNTPFLPVYFWTGIWGAAFVLLAAVTNLSNLMRYFTRFTDEIFAALISVIFIYEAISALVMIFADLEAKQHHATALLSLLLALGTWVIATQLSKFRASKYLNVRVREFLADFGPMIAIVTMTAFALWMNEVDLDVLPAPDKFGTTSGRDWLIDPFAGPLWVIGACIAPGFFVSVLVFLDQNITARLINSPDHKLTKGTAYHWDLMLVSILMAFCSLLGLPWLVAATVRSLNHVRSLASFGVHKDNSSTPSTEVESVNETRVTGILIHVLLGGSLLLLGVIKLIPMAVLFGLFLFMGIVSMKSNQLFERLNLWLMDPQFYPDTHYMKRVPTSVIHKFTFLQLGCLAVLWVVKTSVLGILFPVFIALLVPLRFLLSRYMKAEDLEQLDGEEHPEEEEQQWV